MIEKIKYIFVGVPKIYIIILSISLSFIFQILFNSDFLITIILLWLGL